MKGEKYSLLDHGHVIYVDHMGTDMDIIDAARVSYDGKGKSSDRDLLRYLMRHRHTSPFEMCELKVIIKCPMHVARQWIRHRTASLNEVSGRYSQLPNEMFVPEVVAYQATDNKQGRGEEFTADVQRYVKKIMVDFHDLAYKTYEELLEGGVAKETARGVLPLDTYTEFVWKIDLHNLMHFLKLRLDQHAQYEIRVYAEAINELAWRLWPETMEAFHFYQVDGITLSRAEKVMVATVLRHSPNAGRELKSMREIMGAQISDREWKEFVTKLELSDILET